MTKNLRDHYELYQRYSIRDLQKAVGENTVRKRFRRSKHPLNAENMAVFTANLHGEVSELWEAFRDGKLREPCDKAEKMKALGLPPLSCLEEELADIIIRALDVADAAGVDIKHALAAKHVYNTTRPVRHGGKRA